jgi:hypothetical protein
LTYHRITPLLSTTRGGRSAADAEDNSPNHTRDRTFVLTEELHECHISVSDRRPEKSEEPQMDDRQAKDDQENAEHQKKRILDCREWDRESQA